MTVPAGRYHLTVTEETDTGSQDIDLGVGVQRAFVLGWHVAELHLSAFGRDEPVSVPVGPLLPGPESFDHEARWYLLLAQISADLDSLGVERGSRVRPLRASPTADDRTGDPSLGLPLIELPKAGSDVNDMHVAICIGLAAKHADLGKSYSLGVALGQLVLRAERSAPTEIGDIFDRSIVRELYSQIKYLKSRFPPYAADPVAATLSDWGVWAARAGHEVLAAGKGLGVETMVHERIREYTRDRLPQQGHAWRALLGGEKTPTDYLLLANYTTLASRLLRDYWRVARAFLVGWATLLLLAGTLGLAIAAFVFLSKFTGNLIAGAATVIGAVLGSVVGLGAAFHQMVAPVDKGLWETELTASIAEAIDFVPRWPSQPTTVRLRDDSGLASTGASPNPPSSSEP